MREFGPHLTAWGLDPHEPLTQYDPRPQEPQLEGHYIDEAGEAIPVGAVDYSSRSAEELTDTIIPELYAESEDEDSDAASRQIAREMYLAACRQQIVLLQESNHTPDWLNESV